MQSRLYQVGYMFIQEIILLPVNILQMIIAVVAGFSALLICNLKRFRGFTFLFLYYLVLMLLNFMEETRTTDTIYLITPVFTLLKGPLIYFMTRTLINERPMSTNCKLIHFIPALIAIPMTHFVQEIVVFATFSQIIYLTLSLKLLRRYHSVSMAVCSDAHTMKLNWIGKVLILLMFFAIVDLTRLNFQTFNSQSIKATWYFIDILIAFGIVCYLVFNIIRKPLLFNDMVSYEDLATHAKLESKKSEFNLANDVYQSIEQIITSRELYKQPRLSVINVANETGYKVKDISWSINLVGGHNFCEFINKLRIIEVKEQILQSQSNKKTILEIAFESGFNSKSVFYTAFKSEEGMTPTQFMKSSIIH
jgi:AraC-like DNA-binding protein